MEMAGTRRAEGIGLPEGTGGGGVREQSSPPGRRGRGTLGGEGASATVLGHGAGVTIGKCHSWDILERTRERPGGAQESAVDVVTVDGGGDGDWVEIPWDQLATSGSATNIIVQLPQALLPSVASSGHLYFSAFVCLFRRPQSQDLPRKGLCAEHCEPRDSLLGHQHISYVGTQCHDYR
jgi:hypothetical protein